MGLTSHTQWKEELIVIDEQGNSFCFGCGWGVEPPVAYIPAEKDWTRCVPDWLHARRDEVIEVMKQQDHVVHEWDYPELRRPR